MEVFLYNSNVCRLCGEENDNGTFLYSCDDNDTNLSEVINTYLPLKVQDDEQLPRTICPGCTIQLEATVEFLTLIINGQKIIRKLHQREKEYKKTMLPTPEQDVITRNVVYEVNTSDGVYHVEHPISLQVAGLDKPKRKRGRPPKKHKTPEELAKEAAAKLKQDTSVQKNDKEKEEPTGKRRRKAPTRFQEVVQGKELEKILKDEGVTDGEDSDSDLKPKVEMDVNLPVSKEPEVIGHMENSGELVVFVKGKGRGRPKGPMRPTRKECAICGVEFSCAGRYMSHVAQHGPVIYQCSQCNENFDAHLNFVNHQKELGHTGKKVIPINKKNAQKIESTAVTTEAQNTSQQPITETPDVGVNMSIDNVMTSLPDLGAEPPNIKPDVDVLPEKTSVNATSDPSIETIMISNEAPIMHTEETNATTEEVEQSTKDPLAKVRLKCNHCDKTFSSKQSKSLHIKATHLGERPYACAECGARFAYPRSLALHAVSHRRSRGHGAKGFACDLCGKVLNHPSSVVYHKEAEHAGQRYVCNKCGKSFKHKQLLQRHQLVHTQVRPYTCKVCNASFKTKTNLLNHQLLHTGVKKFSCEICKHKFAHKTSLTLHMRWHTGQKPYSCETCGKSFSQKGNLAEHERIHTGEKPFQCALCPRRFTTSSQRRLHARRHPPDCAPRRLVTHPRREGPRDPAPHRHRKQAQKQISLLASSQPQQEQIVEQTVVVPTSSPTAFRIPEDSQDDSLEEGVIYVTYNVDDAASPAFQILSPEQTADVEDTKVLTSCELYSGSSLLVPEPELEHLELQQDLDELPDPLVLEERKHIPVTDEQGNPLHFTMQDGTRLAITSADGQSLQVITEDGQTIPVEINGYADEEQEVDESQTIVHQLNLQKNVEDEISEPVTHYFTIV